MSGYVSYKGFDYLVESDINCSQPLTWRLSVYTGYSYSRQCIHVSYLASSDSASDVAKNYINLIAPDVIEPSIDAVHRKAISRLLQRYPTLECRQLYRHYLDVCPTFISQEIFERYLAQVTAVVLL